MNSAFRIVLLSLRVSQHWPLVLPGEPQEVCVWVATEKFDDVPSRTEILTEHKRFENTGEEKKQTNTSLQQVESELHEYRSGVSNSKC